ncbi:MAG TPA: hypothetical protein DHV03_02620 [Alphaproteobacteria bacterium]|nr:hypothetical protein [Alphaproteobacteria bacterium]
MASHGYSALMNWHQTYGVDDILMNQPRDFTAAKPPQKNTKTQPKPLPPSLILLRRLIWLIWPA